MLNAKDVVEFLAYALRVPPQKFEVRDRGDYFILSFLNTRRKVSLQSGTTVIILLQRMRLLYPKFSRRIRDYVAVNKKWGSIDAACILYARGSRLRLMCTGRPEAVELIVDMVKPNSITVLPWNPSLLRQCAGKEIYYYYTTMKTPVFICRL